MALDPDKPTALWTLVRWLGLGLQRLIRQVVALVAAALGILLVALFIPAHSAGDAATFAGVISGVLLFFGGAAAAAVAQQLARPALALCVVAAVYVAFTAAGGDE